jgi:hypothetical protein
MAGSGPILVGPAGAAANARRRAARPGEIQRTVSQLPQVPAHLKRIPRKKKIVPDNRVRELGRDAGRLGGVHEGAATRARGVASTPTSARMGRVHDGRAGGTRPASEPLGENVEPSSAARGRQAFPSGLTVSERWIEPALEAVRPTGSSAGGRRGGPIRSSTGLDWTEPYHRNRLRLCVYFGQKTSLSGSVTTQILAAELLPSHCVRVQQRLAAKNVRSANKTGILRSVVGLGYGVAPWQPSPAREAVLT